MTAFTILSFFGILASACGEIWYLRLLMARRVVASLPAFVIFTFTTALAGASAISLGVWQDGVVPLVFACSHVVLIVVIVRLKQRVSFHLLDWVWVGLAMVSGVCWWVFDNPWIAFFCAFAIDLFGYFALFHKMARAPGTENAAAWLIGALAYGLPLLGGCIDAVPFHYNSLFSWLNFTFCVAVATMQWVQQAKNELHKKVEWL